MRILNEILAGVYEKRANNSYFQAAIDMKNEDYESALVNNSRAIEYLIRQAKYVRKLGNSSRELAKDMRVMKRLSRLIMEEEQNKGLSEVCA